MDSLNPAPFAGHVVGSRVLVYDALASTNDQALRLGGDGTVVVADCQTAGRGCHGRAWHSAPGLGIWCSVRFEGTLEGLLFAAVLSVRDAVRPLLGQTAGELAVKWPNDLLVNGRKLGGFMVECREDQTVLGMGLNVRHRPHDFPSELHARATSLHMETGIEWERGPILRAILEALDQRVLLLRDNGFTRIQREWAEACHIEGRQIRYGTTEGRVVGMDATGALLVNGAQGALRVAFGDIVELDGVE